VANYGTEAGFAAYAGSTGQIPAAGEVVPALVRASAYIDGKYGLRFPGAQTGGYAQLLAWPRTGARTAQGFNIPTDAIPPAIENATYEAALRELRAPGSLSPDFVGVNAVKRKKVGPIEKEYAVSDKTTAADALPVITVIDQILSSLLIRALPGILVV
jgi:hypothetical protein